MATAKTPEKKTPAKKVSPTTSAKTRNQVQSLKVEEPAMITPKMSSPESMTQKKAFKVKKRFVLWVVVIIALGALLYFGRSIFVAAVVNGQPISRIQILKEAEKQSGKQALDTAIRNALIEQEARRANVSVTDKEIDDEIKKVEATLSKQGQKLDEVLKMQGMNRKDLRKLIRLDKLVGKIVGKDIKVSDKEVADYIEKNKSTLPEGQKEDELKASVKDRLQQQKLSEKVTSWLQGLQGKANIMYFVQY